MKPSGIGGQAVMEGVMMKNKSTYAVAVRKPDNEIVVDVQEYHSITERVKFLGLPFLRGTVNFIESMIIGMRTLTYSANFFETEEESKANADDKTEDKKASELSTGALVLTILTSLLLTVALFFFLPLALTELFGRLFHWNSAFFTSLTEGLVRIANFVGYVLLISRMKEIKRVFMYHGAEHKTINCIEQGYPLTVENARKASKEHKRCGTSFMLIVMVISILVFSIVNLLPLYTGQNVIVRLLVRFGVRILLLPVVAGISYEFLRLAGRSENKIVNLLSRPGMWMQALTTKEPDDSMLEVAIRSVEAVFDWNAFLQEEHLEACECP